ncbi:anthranilate phosphoribosyltransferase [bacterium]|nr:anthranilate phosphoribosyltransferase [bacterium]
MEIREAIERCAARRSLSQDEAGLIASQLLTGQFSDAQAAGFLMAMRMKGETVDEIAGFARIMRREVLKVQVDHAAIVDTCGTGGDGSGTFNVSTVSALVAAGAGCKVVKHGNRSVSSRCGSADLLESLGCKINLKPEQVSQSVDDMGFGFCFAPVYHPAMRHVARSRKELGIRTLFNILGPLTNPAGARRQVLGVYNPGLLDTMASVLQELGADHVLVVHGTGGLDELSLSGETQICELRYGAIWRYALAPEDVGLPRVPVSAIAGGGPEENARLALSVLAGEKGPYRLFVLLNAGAAIYAAGLAESMREGVDAARNAIDNGAAMNVIEQLRLAFPGEAGVSNG